MKNTDLEIKLKSIDDNYSNRFIKLDPKGYFLIKISKQEKKIVIEHYSNDIDLEGRATDPETGIPIQCSETKKRIPTKTITGKTAKEIGIQITESHEELLLSKLDHALYLGRELQKAEYCLIHEIPYVQD